MTPQRFQGPGQDVGRHGGDRDGASAHGSRIVDQQRHHGVAKVGLLLHLVRERVHGVGDDPRQAGGVQQTFLEVEVPGPRLFGHQTPLQPVGEPRDDALQVIQLLVQHLTQACQLVGIAEIRRLDHLVVLCGKGMVSLLVRRVAAVVFRPAPGLTRLLVGRAVHHFAVRFGCLLIGRLGIRQVGLLSIAGRSAFAAVLARRPRRAADPATPRTGPRRPRPPGRRPQVPRRWSPPDRDRRSSDAPPWHRRPDRR